MCSFQIIPRMMVPFPPFILQGLNGLIHSYLLFFCPKSSAFIGKISTHIVCETRSLLRISAYFLPLFKPARKDHLNVVQNVCSWRWSGGRRQHLKLNMSNCQEIGRSIKVELSRQGYFDNNTIICTYTCIIDKQAMAVMKTEKKQTVKPSQRYSRLCAHVYVQPYSSILIVLGLSPRPSSWNHRFLTFANNSRVTNSSRSLLAIPMVDAYSTKLNTTNCYLRAN